jgi:hypothetical protein
MLAFIPLLLITSIESMLNTVGTITFTRLPDDANLPFWAYRPVYFIGESNTSPLFRFWVLFLHSFGPFLPFRG